jgi:hypothetical protein
VLFLGKIKWFPDPRRREEENGKRWILKSKKEFQKDTNTG